MIAKYNTWNSKIPVTIKVTLWYTTFLFIVLAVLVIFAFVYTGDAAYNISKTEMSKAINEIAAGEQDYTSYHEGIYIIRYDADGTLTDGRLPNSFQGDVDFQQGEFQEYTQGTYHYLYLDAQITKGEYKGGWLRGIVSLSALTNKMMLFPYALVIISPFILLIVAFVGYKIIKKAFRPVKQISKTAAEIGKEYDLSKRIRLTVGEDEIHQMAGAFNEMLDSLESSSNREKQFTSDVSHELRTPISVILAESQFGTECAETVDDAKESFKVITRQSRRMSKIVSQLLEISRMDQLTTIEKKRFNLSEVLNSMIRDYKSLCEEKSLILKDDIDDKIYIDGDIMMIQRLFDNLFSDAVKFAKSQITVTLKADVGKCVLSIKDDGPGISKKDQHKIWERFYQTDESRNKSFNDGVGLGLSMVKKIVTLHNGAIWVESKLGEGSTFVVKLILAEPK